MDNHTCVFEDPKPLNMIYFPTADALDDISISSNLSDVPYPENTVTEIRCTVVNCYPEPLVTLQLDDEPLEGFEETGMDVHFAVKLEICYNQLPLTCCAGGAEWTDTCSDDSYTPDVHCVYTLPTRDERKKFGYLYIHPSA